jgi:mannose-1-phosphate guanylyltransferase
MKLSLAAAVLCGGRGERLRPLTDYFQKAMVPVGEKKRPLLEYIVRLLAFHRVESITMPAGYKMEEIRDYFKDGSSFGVEIGYSRDRRGEGGSLGALANAPGNGSIPECETLDVYYGDILSDLEVGGLVRSHREEHKDSTLVLSKGYTLPVGVAKVRGGGRGIAMDEKPRMDFGVTTGCMALGPKAMKLAMKTAREPRSDLMSDLVPELLKRRAKVCAYYTTGLWHDIGTIKSYEKLNSEIREDTLSSMSR